MPLAIFGAVFLVGVYLILRPKGGTVTIENLSAPDDVLNLPPPKDYGVRRNNPGNIRFIDPSRAFRGQIGNDAGFGVYDTIPNGVRALYQQLLTYKRRGIVTVRSIISTYAPSGENPTEKYIQFISGRLGVSDTATIDVVEYRPRITQAIIRFEQGRDPFTYEEIDKWTQT